jgi:glycosyltransferase involved in cell wall biosynthesis
VLKRVRMVQFFFPPEGRGGAEAQAIALGTHMRDQGVEIEIIGAAPIRQTPSTDLAVPLRPLGWNRVFDSQLEGRIDDYSGLRRVAQLVRYDGYLLALHRFLRATSKPGDVVVFTFLSPMSGVGCHACEGLCPTVTEWAGELAYHEPSFKTPAIRPFGSRIRGWALRSSHFVSRFEKGLAELEALGYSEERRSYLPLGVDTARFSPAEDRAAVREKLGLPVGDFVISYVARLRPKKEHASALAAVGEAVTLGVPAQLLVIGDGPLRDSLRQTVEEMGLRKHVTFCGAVEDVPSYLRASDIGMLLSSTEGPSLAVAEAMACGLPVIATDVGGLPDTVISGQNGVLVPVGDHLAAAEAIEMLWRNPDRLATMAGAARSFVLEERDLSVISERYLGILKSVAAKWHKDSVV